MLAVGARLELLGSERVLILLLLLLQPVPDAPYGQPDDAGCEEVSQVAPFVAPEMESGFTGGEEEGHQAGWHEEIT